MIIMYEGMVSKEGYLRNLLVDYIRYDREAMMLGINTSGDDEKEILRKVNIFRRLEEDLTLQDVERVKRDMERKLRKCLKEIDGYSH